MAHGFVPITSLYDNKVYLLDAQSVAAAGGGPSATAWQLTVGATLSTPLGQATMANSLPVVIASDQSAIPVTFTAQAGDVNASGPLNADNAIVAVALSGHQSAGFHIAAGTLAGTVTAVVSFDGGATVQATDIIDPVTEDTVSPLVLTNPSAAQNYSIRLSGGETHVGLQVHPYSSGTATATVTATQATRPLAMGQQVKANSLSVVIASDQGALVVGGNQATNNNVSTNTNPILIAGSDYAGTPKIQNWKVDSTGVGYMNLAQVLGSAVASSNPLPTAERYFQATASAYPRPANVTAYTANDAVSNNGTAASVTAISVTVANVNNAPIALTRLKLMSTDTGLATASAQFRAYIFNSDPTANSGVGAGDNSPWSQKQAGFVGSMVGTFRSWSDGSSAILTPDEGPFVITTPVSGAETLFILLQTLTGFTPSANSTTFTATLEGVQGAA